ncbi:MAG: DUF1553 domain-containing protein, partial [Planctomycetales bacterium]|nr:DUF1553 domain-containing protein [Planctomycetales bacterium]
MDGNRKDPSPVVKVLTDEQKTQLADAQSQLEQLRTELATQVAAFEYVEPETPAKPQPAEPKEFVWIDDAVPTGAKADGGWQFVDNPKPLPSGQKASTRKAEGLSQHFFTGASEPLRVAEGDRLFTYVYLDPKNTPKEIMLQWNDGSWDHRAYWGGNHIDWGVEGSVSRKRIGDLPPAGEWVRLEVSAADVGLNPGAVINGWAFTQFDGTTYWDKAGIVSKADQQPVYDSLVAWLQDQAAAKGSALPEPLKTAINIEPDKRSDKQHKALRDHFVEHVYVGSRAIFNPLHEKIAAMEKRAKEIEDSAATTLVFREAKSQKPAYMLERGEYDRRKDEVKRATPAILPPMPEGVPNDRLGFANWLVDPAHPLTARVTVNRLWQQVFGTGIVKTSEDFGSQGEPPSHPELLDWLAVQFIEDGWDVKHLMKRFVMSAAYRQSSQVTPEKLERDPKNRLLARGPRYRLDAEMLRDQALAVSGLIVDQMGGPSVKPPQPDGLWFAVGYSGSNTVRFKQDEGPNKLYRRTL